jgi:RimJ/RimL family protein N-acetyltransferase
MNNLRQKIMQGSVAIVQLGEDDWEKYRAIRLAALQEDPLAFAGIYAEEINIPEIEWRKHMHTIWFALVDAQIIGSIGLVHDTKIRYQQNAWLYAFWIHPSYRSQGIGMHLLFYIQKIAQLRNVHKVSLQVTSTQQAAIAVYKRIGFKIVGHFREEIYDNGMYYDLYRMELLMSKIDNTLS